MYTYKHTLYKTNALETLETLPNIFCYNKIYIDLPLETYFLMYKSARETRINYLYGSGQPQKTRSETMITLPG